MNSNLLTFCMAAGRAVEQRAREAETIAVIAAHHAAVFGGLLAHDEVSAGHGGAVAHDQDDGIKQNLFHFSDSKVFVVQKYVFFCDYWIFLQLYAWRVMSQLFSVPDNNLRLSRMTLYWMRFNSYRNKDFADSTKSSRFSFLIL